MPIRPLRSLRHFWQSRGWFAQASIVLALLFLLALVTAKPAYRHFVNWRCERNMALATEALRNGNNVEARNRAVAVLRYRRNDIEVIRLTAKAMDRINDPKSGSICRFLLHHPKATTEDRLWAWKRITRIFPLAIVARDWAFLGLAERHEQKNPDFFLPLADRLIKEKLFKDALGLLGTVKKSSETPPEIERCILRILIGSGNKKYLAEAQARLTERIDLERPDIPALLPELAVIPKEKLDFELGRALVRWLFRQKNPDCTSFLAVSRFLYGLATNDSAADTIAEFTIRRWKDTEPLALARWLIQIGRPETALEFIPAETPGTAASYRLRRDTRAALDQWKDLLAFLQSDGMPPKGIRKLEWHFDIARTARHLGSTSLFAEQWSAAMTEARIIPFRGFFDLARMAKDAGLDPEAEIAMLEAIRSAQGPLPFYRSLTPLINSLYRQGKAEDMLNILTVYLPIEPTNPAILIHFTYLKTILGQADPDLTHRFLDPLLEKDPANPTILRIFALQNLIAGNPQKAVETIRPAAEDPEKSAPVNRLVYGIALVASGNTKQGLPIVESIDWDRFMPAERTLFDELLTAAKKNLDPQAQEKIDAAAKARSKAADTARKEAARRSEKLAEARAKARPEAEAKTKALLEARQRAEEKAKAKIRDESGGR